MSPELAFRVRADYNARWASQVVADAKKVESGVSESGAQMARSLGNANYATANLAAQFNDIGVQLASGTSPFLIAIQQGTQISQVLGPMGAGAAAKSLGAAFLSLLNPISLLTIGTIALGGAAVQWLMSLRQEAPEAEEALEKHSEWLRKILEGYDDASEAVDRYLKEAARLPRSVVVSDLTAGLEAANAAITAQIARTAQQQRELRGFIAQVEAMRKDSDNWASDDPLFSPERFEAMLAQARALDAIAISADTSTEELGQVMGAMREMIRISDEPAVRDLAQDFYALAEGLMAAKVQAISTGAALGAMTGIELPKSYYDALGGLKGLGQRPLTDRDRAASARDEGLKGAYDDATRLAVMNEYEAALARISEREQERDARRKVGLDEAAEGLKRLQDEGRNLEMSLATPFDMLNRELDRLGHLLNQGAIDFETFTEAANRMRLGTASEVLGMVGQISGAMSQMFQDNKAIQLANVGINTAAGVARTLADYGGTPFGWAAVAGVIATGAAQAATIMSAQPGSASVPSASAAGSSGGGAAAATPQTVVNVSMPGGRRSYSREELREMFEDIQNASKYGLKVQFS